MMEIVTTFDKIGSVAAFDCKLHLTDNFIVEFKIDKDIVRSFFETIFYP